MKKFFNLVEVTLAIAVVGIGVAGVMSLFPVGFQASRDAIGDNYAADAAEQFISYISRKCNDPTKNYSSSTQSFWDCFITDDKDTIDDLSDDVDGILTSTKPTAANETAASWETTPIEGNIYPTNPIGTGQLYRIKAGTASVTDFHATVRIWRSQVKNVWLFEQNRDIPYSMATRLNVEISWPVEKPYDTREKRFYSVELFRQAE